MKQIIALLMENQPGALSRVVGLFSQRGYNIETLNVAPTADPTLSRLTLSTEASALVTAQICKHLNRLVDVAQVVDLSSAGVHACELVLIKIRYASKDRDTLKKKLDTWNSQFNDSAPNIMIVQFAGNPEKIRALVAELSDYKIIEMVRSGVVGISKDTEAMRP
jgi:acetolactate synthase-1/3 small subunit